MPGLRGLEGAVTGAGLVTGPPFRLRERTGVFTELFGFWGLGQQADAVLTPRWARPLRKVLRRVWAAGGSAHVSLSYPTDGPDEDGMCLVSCSLVSSFQEPALLILVAWTAPPAVLAQAGGAMDDRRLLSRYEALLSAAPQVVWVMTKDGTVTPLANRAGRTPEGLWRPDGEATWSDAVHPKDRGWFGRVWQEATRKQSVIDIVVRVRLRSDPERYRHVKVIAAPVLDGSGEPEWVGTITDAEDHWRTRMRERLLACMAAVPAARDLTEAFMTTASAVVPDLVDCIAIFQVHHPTDVGFRAVEGALSAAPTARVALAPGLPPLPPLTEDFALGSAAKEVMDNQVTKQLTFPAGRPPEGPISDASVRWLRQAGATSLVLLPVVVEGRTVALASAANCRGNPPPDETDLALLHDVLQQMSGPLRRTLELQGVRGMALALQQSFLAAPPAVEGAVVTAVYHPADSTAEVGGDWYDAINLSGGAVALTIGDIAGHDMDAATTMGRVNSMLRGLAYDSGPTASPAATLGRLDRIVQALDTPSLVTVVHAVLNPAPPDGWHLVLSNAGHPPPLLIPADAPPRYLHELSAPDPPLCVSDDVPRTDLQAFLREGDTLVLYTDGLVEVPGRDITHSLENLRVHAETLVRRGLTLSTLVQSLLPPVQERRDDIAVIALQVRRKR